MNDLSSREDENYDHNQIDYLEFVMLLRARDEKRCQLLVRGLGLVSNFFCLAGLMDLDLKDIPHRNP